MRAEWAVCGSVWPGLESGVWFGLEFGKSGQSDVDDEEVQQRTAGLGGKPVLDTSFTGSSQLSYKLINEAMAAPGGGPVLVPIGISSSTGTGLGQDFPRLSSTCPDLIWSWTWTWTWT